MRFGQAPEDADALVNFTGNRWDERQNLEDRNILDTNCRTSILNFETSRITTAAVCRAFALERETQGVPLKAFIQEGFYSRNKIEV